MCALTFCLVFLCPHCPGKDKELFITPVSCPTLLPSPTLQGNHCSVLCHHKLASSALEFHLLGEKHKYVETKQPMDRRGNQTRTQNYLETNENENTTFQNLWNAAEEILRGKFIALEAYLKKRENLK